MIRSDDLLGNKLAIHRVTSEHGEGVEELADRFMVSLRWGKKLRGQFERIGKMEWVEQRRGTPRTLLEDAREQLRGWVLTDHDWVLADHDVTLNQLQAKRRGQFGVAVSRAHVARVLKGLGLRLKRVAPRRRARHRGDPQANQPMLRPGSDPASGATAQ